MVTRRFYYNASKYSMKGTWAEFGAKNCMDFCTRQIVNLFLPAQRGLAITLYCVAPSLGLILGPVVGGFISQNAVWRWLQGVVLYLYRGDRYSQRRLRP
jgi:hypothetical protein